MDFDIEAGDGVEMTEIESNIRQGSIDQANSAWAEQGKNIFKGANVGDIKIDENGDLTTEVNGKKVNLSEMRADVADGKVEASYREAGVDVNDPNIKPKIQELQEEVNNTPKGKVRVAEDKVASNLKKLQDSGVDLEKLNKANSFDELKQALGDKGKILDDWDEKFKNQKNTPEMKEINDRLKKLESAEDLKKDPDLLQKMKNAIASCIDSPIACTLKTFLRVAIIVMLILVSKDFFDFLKNVAHALSGCWSNTDSGSCKIRPLTCDDDDVNGGSSTMFFPAAYKGYDLCDECTTNFIDPNCGKNATDLWIPVLNANFCNCGDPNSNYLSGYNWQSTTGDNKCTKCNKPTATGTPACPNASGCISRQEACSDANKQNDNCSSWCSTSKIKTLPGQSISCKQGNLSTALASVLGDGLNDLFGGLLGPLEKILIYVAIGIVILVVGYIAIRVIINTLTEDDDSSSQRIVVTTAPQTTTTTAAFRKNKYYK